MKKFIIFIGIGLMFLFSSCANEDLAPILVFETLGKGAVIQFEESQGSTVFDLANFSTATYSYTVKFSSIDDGENVAQYDVYVSFIDNTPGNGDNSKAETTFVSIPSSEFGTASDGLPSATVNISLPALASQIGLSEDDVSATDLFRFRGVITLDDGSTFGSANSTPTVNSASFNAYFDFSINLSCPLPDNLFVGDYALTYDEVSGAWNEAMVEETVTLTVTSPIRRSFNATYLQLFGGFGVNVTLHIECDAVAILERGIGAGCAGTTITMVPGEPQPIDITDDSEIVVHYIEETRGCGAGSPVRIFRLTKL